MSDLEMALPPSLHVQQRGEVALLTIARAEKRNALDDATVQGLGRFFATPPSWAKVVVLDADMTAGTTIKPVLRF